MAPGFALQLFGVRLLDVQSARLGGAVVVNVNPAATSMTPCDRGIQTMCFASRRALDYARQVNVRLRKGTQVPYIAHLLGVASLVLGDISDPDL